MMRLMRTVYNQKDETLELRAMFVSLAKAWDNGDGAAFADCFTEDCDYVTFSGDHLKGRKEVADMHQKLFDGVLRGSKMEGEGVSSIRFISNELAIVHNVGTIRLRWQKKAPKGRNSINTNVVVKEHGTWRISAFHNCRIKAPNFVQKWMMK
ncbi:MAG: hypothetical protein K0R67_762 [Paenibacillus sp.]|nr:hypothetical protein [Paenibacillus sp.]